MTKRDATERPAEQGGLPNEYTPGRAEATEQGRPAEGLDQGELLISGVNTGPAREERESLSPTEERARLSFRSEEREADQSDNPEADLDSLVGRGD